jgi:adenylate cyclase
MVGRTMGLFGRSALLAVGIAAVPLVVLAWVLLDGNRDALRLDADVFHVALVERLRTELTAHLRRAENELDRFGAQLFAPGDEQVQAAALAHRLEAADAPLASVTLYGADGLRRGTLARPGAQNADGPPQLAPLLRGDGFSVGDARVVDGQLRLPVSLSSVDAAGAGVWLYSELALTDFVGRLVEQAQRTPLNRPDAVVLLDTTSRLVIASGAGLSSFGSPSDTDGLFDALGGSAPTGTTSALATEYAADSQRMLGAVGFVGKPGWAVVVRRPLAQAYATYEALKRFALGVLLAALTVAVCAALVGARWLTQPLAALTAATQALASRAFTRVPKAVSSRHDEVGVLGRSFDSMAESLQASEAKVVAEVRVRDALARYLSSEVVDAVVANPDTLKLGGERREVTVMFADVVGFTRLSETLPPETIVALLNELFTFATDIVHRQGGMVDKFIGDSVMAVWGLPHERPDDARRAVAAADDLRRWVEAGNRRWKKQYGVELQLGIGLHSGPAVAGNVGSEKRMDFTVIGDTVNVAARLESAAEPGQILLSAATRSRLGSTDVSLKEVGPQTLRGRITSTTVYEVG